MQWSVFPSLPVKHNHAFPPAFCPADPFYLFDQFLRRLTTLLISSRLNTDFLSFRRALKSLMVLFHAKRLAALSMRLLSQETYALFWQTYLKISTRSPLSGGSKDELVIARYCCKILSEKDMK
jgi:hypothetical protein